VTASGQISIESGRAVVCNGKSRLFWNFVSDDEPIRGHVVHLQCQCFGDPHAGYGEQAEERCVHCRSDRACRMECRCGAKQSCDLVRTVDVRPAPLGDGVTERIRCRNLMPVLGVHRQREPPHGEQPIAAPPVVINQRLHSSTNSYTRETTSRLQQELRSVAMFSDQMAALD
jgi:hypothetical protein